MALMCNYMYDNGSSLLQGFDGGSLGRAGWTRPDKKVSGPAVVKTSFGYKSAYKPSWAYDQSPISLRNIWSWATHFFFFLFLFAMCSFMLYSLLKHKLEKKKEEEAHS